MQEERRRLPLLLLAETSKTAARHERRDRRIALVSERPLLDVGKGPL